MLATFEFNFSFHLFVKHYTNTLGTQILVENAIKIYIKICASNLVEIDLKFNLRMFKFKKFPGGGGGMPPDPPRRLVLHTAPKENTSDLLPVKISNGQSNLFLVGRFVRVNFYPYIVLCTCTRTQQHTHTHTV